MRHQNARLTITVDPCLMAYAEHLVASGRAASISVVFSQAMTEKAYRDRRRRSRWQAKAKKADPERVTRMMGHIDEQLASLNRG